MLRIEYVYSDDIIIINEDDAEEVVDYLNDKFKYVEVNYKDSYIEFSILKDKEVNIQDLMSYVESRLIVTSFKII